MGQAIIRLHYLLIRVLPSHDYFLAELARLGD